MSRYAQNTDQPDGNAPRTWSASHSSDANDTDNTNTNNSNTSGGVQDDSTYPRSSVDSFWMRRKNTTGNHNSLLSISSEDTVYSNATWTKIHNGISTKACPTKTSTLWAWRFEFMSLLVSVVTFGIMVAFLVLFHDTGLPEFLFAHKVNFNTVVNGFGIVMRSTLVFIGAEVIGQAKWSWMKKPRPLRDVEHFSNASKGPSGALKLILSNCKPTMATLGAVVVIASSVVGLFLQQAAKPALCVVETVGSASIAYTRWVAWTASDTNSRLCPELQGVALNGMLFGERASTPQKLSNCSSGVCRFDEVAGVTHSSAGLCSKCVDTTAALRQSIVSGSDATVYHFGDMAGFNLTWPPADGRVFNMMSEDPDQSSHAFSSLLAFRPAGCAHGPQNNISTSEHDDWRTCQYRAFSNDNGRYARAGHEVDIIAVNCTLSPCVRHLYAEVINGNLDEKLVFEQPITNLTDQLEGAKFPYKGPMYTTMVEPCIVNGTWYDRHNISEAARDGSWTSWGERLDDVNQREAPTECVRAIGQNMMFGLQRFLASTLAGVCTVKSNYRPELDKGGVISAGGENKQQLQFNCGDRWLLDRLYDRGRISFENIAKAYDGMIVATNNRLRGYFKSKHGEVLFTKGYALEAVVCIHATWLWLAYPGALLLLAAGLLVAAYVQSCRERDGQPIWKSTILPLLFYNVHTAVGDRGAEATTSLLTIGELRTLADKTSARFDADVGFVVETLD